MTADGIDRTGESDWECVARETLWQVLTRLGEELAVTVETVADAVYWGNDPDAEQVDRLRQAVFDLEYVTEAYVARLCPDAEPWGDDAERTPSWQPAEPGEQTGADTDEEGPGVAPGDERDDGSGDDHA